MKTLNELKQLTTRALELDELVYWNKEANALAAGFNDIQEPVPEWLAGLQSQLKLEIKVRVHDRKVAALSEARARRAAIATPDEKRAALDARIAELEKEVGTA